MTQKSPSESEIFRAALHLAPVKRAAYLNEACRGNRPLLDEVESLLRAHDPEGSFLKSPAAAITIDKPISEGPGSIIGPYKLREKIGEGGFGVVYVAEQEQPVRRKVALKIIKPGMDTKDVIARFEAERQALALMDHPNVARVLDAGATEIGRPYFVMELVQGVTITDFCDKNSLPTRERLALFADVCRAVQHAHQKGIIHRDLKPTNIMVTLHDGKPVAKVIDFGVSKALRQQLTEKSIYTAYGQMIGTPSYMSPEQAEMSGLGIDTRSDIYSLGVLLYELLTGQTPLDARRLRSSGYAEILRIIREEEPPRPSLRISTLGEQATAIAQQRHTDVKQLRRDLSGELDWIVMKCLEKDRARRYETAVGLARDVERYLDDEVVEARPPSAGYRLRKFARKHRMMLTTTCAIAALLVVGIGVSTWQAVRATRAERMALAAADAERLAKVEAEKQRENALQSAEREADARKKAEAARAEAQAKEAEATAVVTFFEDKVFAAGRAKGQGGLEHDISLRDAIRASLPALATSFSDQPLVEARLRHALGGTFDRLGDPIEAAAQREQALALRIRHLGPDHPDTLKAMNNLAISYQNLNRHAEALKLLEETLAACKRVLPPDDPITFVCKNTLANSYQNLNRHAEALKLREEKLARDKRVLGPNHLHTLRSKHNLAISYQALNRYDEALKLFDETLTAKKRVLPPDHPDTLQSMLGLANIYAALNRHAEALKLFDETLTAQKRVLPPDHPDTLRSMYGLAASYAVLNRYADALPLLDEILAKADRPEISPERLSVAIALRLQCCQKLGDLAGCEAMAELLEKRNPTDAVGLYNAACCRAMTASLQAKANEPDAARLAQEDADKAMAWLTKAVAAGYKDANHMQKDTDLEFLRDREDFKKLVAELKASAHESAGTASKP